MQSVVQVAQKKDKIVENVLLDFSLEIWYYIYRGKKENKPLRNGVVSNEKNIKQKAFTGLYNVGYLNRCFPLDNSKYY